MDLTENTTKPVVLPVVLKGPNYLLWSRTTKAVLCGRGLWSHIENVQSSNEADKEDDEKKSSSEKDTKEAKKEKWFQEDQAVLSLLQNSLDAPILEAYS